MRATLRSILTIASRALASFLRHEGPNHAAAAAFYCLLSVIPMFFVTVLILGEILGDRGQALAIAGRQLSGIVPWFDDELMHRVRRLTWAAPRLGVVSMVFIAWTAGLFFAMLRRNLRRPWRGAEEESRPAWRQGLRFWVVTPAVSALLLAALAAMLCMSALPELCLDRAGLSRLSWLLPAWNFIWPWAFVFVTYLVLLPGARPFGLTLAVSGVLALAGWGITVVFSTALVHMPRRELVYGPLADLVLFLLWLDYNAALLVYGGHFIRLWRIGHPYREQRRLFPTHFKRPRRRPGAT